MLDPKVWQSSPAPRLDLPGSSAVALSQENVRHSYPTTLQVRLFGTDCEAGLALRPPPMALSASGSAPPAVCSVSRTDPVVSSLNGHQGLVGLGLPL